MSFNGSDIQLLSTVLLVLIGFVLGALLTNRAFTAGLKAAVEQSATLKNDQPILDLIAAASKNVDPLVIKDIITPIAAFSNTLAELVKILPGVSASPVGQVVELADNVVDTIAKGAGVPESAQPPLTLVKGTAPEAGQPAG